MRKNFASTLTAIILLCLNMLQVKAAENPVFYSPEASLWADSVMRTLNREQRIAQLMMVSVWSNKDSIHIKEITRLIDNKGIGGLIFFQGGPVREALLTNYYQARSRVPLMIGMDAEWGLSMRIDSTVRYPRQMTMSAINDDSAVYKMGREIAKDCKRLGIHINFAPDADINNNPANPVIGSRSFGDERESVSFNSVQYMKALQDNHILATGKHFPGHGNSETDSHFTLPTIMGDTAELDSMELYPFNKMISAGLGGMMVAHLNVPSLDSTANMSSSLSAPIVTSLLREKLDFNGLIFTDALNMKAVSDTYKPGVVDKLALLAGNDILICSDNIGKALEQIHYAIENCEIEKEEVDARVKKVLMMKYWCGLNQKQFIDTTNLIKDLNNPDAKLLQRNLYEKAMTVLVNKDSLLPFRSKDSLRIACVAIGEKYNNTFHQQLKSYGNFDMFSEDKDAPVAVFNALYNFLDNYDYVIVSLHGTSMKAQTGYGISEAAQRFIDTVLLKYKTVFVDFGNAYTLSRFRNLKSARSVILGYEDFPLTQSIAAQMIMGGVSGEGKLPVSASADFPRNTFVRTGKPIRMQYTIPEAANMSSAVLSKIDSVAMNAIKNKAMPGCQVLVARNGKVVYQKSFGTFAYDYCDTVTNTDLYDIASITKIAATALGTMRLYEKKKIDLNYPVAKYLTKLKSTNKKFITIKEMLAHQAGLQPWIPYYKETISAKGLSASLYKDSMTEDYSLHVADKIYLLNSYVDTINQRIYSSELTEKGKYVYSDLGPIMMKEIIEDITDKPFDQYIDENFYKPLKLSRTGFNPLNHFSESEIVPTENDTVFRKQLIKGFVHDPAAAMLGGVSGNAGVFSDANDLAVIMQMLLNKGSYGGQTFFKPSTVELFTAKQFQKNRRGLLFDKPEPDTTKQSPCTKEASLKTFGHQGFTGTCAWADPEYGLIYIFLSNRVNPDVSNDKFVKMNVRTTIQELIYKSLLDKTSRNN